MEEKTRKNAVTYKEDGPLKSSQNKTIPKPQKLSLYFSVSVTSQYTWLSFFPRMLAVKSPCWSRVHCLTSKMVANTRASKVASLLSLLQEARGQPRSQG